nr:hypothetical protein [Saccharothrix yanglingensis]
MLLPAFEEAVEVLVVQAVQVPVCSNETVPDTDPLTTRFAGRGVPLLWPLAKRIARSSYRLSMS